LLAVVERKAQGEQNWLVTEL